MTDLQKNVARATGDAINSMISLNQIMRDLRDDVLLQMKKYGNNIPLENIPNFNEAKFITTNIIGQIPKTYETAGEHGDVEIVNYRKKIIKETVFLLDSYIFDKNPEKCVTRINHVILINTRNISEFCGLYDLHFELPDGTTKAQFKEHGVNPIPNHDNENNHSR